MPVAKQASTHEYRTELEELQTSVDTFTKHFTTSGAVRGSSVFLKRLPAASQHSSTAARVRLGADTRECLD